MSFTMMYTDCNDPSFVELTKELDKELTIINGRLPNQYYMCNTYGRLNDVLIIYDGKKAIACGGYHMCNNNRVELRKVYVRKEYRGQGIREQLIRQLISFAKLQGYDRMMVGLVKAQQGDQYIYEGLGFIRTKQYGPYRNIPDSICFDLDLLAV